MEVIMNFTNELWNALKPSEEVVRGLKAKLKYCDQNLLCTPIDRNECDEMLNDMKAAENWINSLPGEESTCNPE